MTVQEVQAAAKIVAESITTLIQNFESATGCIVHSLPVRPANANTPTSVDVKVQISA